MDRQHEMRARVGLLGLIFLYPWISGFVLLSNQKAILPVSPDSPTRIFAWDGKAPEIDAKEGYKGGQYQDLDDSAFMERLLADAMSIWNAVPGAYVTLQVTSNPTDAKLDKNDDIFSIVTDSSSNATTAAYAKPYSKDESPNIISDCDISIADRSTKAKDLAYTITHELGHCLGLGHAHTNYGALMGYSRENRSLTLGADDIAGVVYLYPDPAYTTSKPKELICGVIGSKPAAGEQGLFLLLFPIVTLLGAIMARRLLRPLAKSSRFARLKSLLSENSTEIPSSQPQKLIDRSLRTPETKPLQQGSSALHDVCDLSGQAQALSQPSKAYEIRV
jgi:hypothetical protein